MIKDMIKIAKVATFIVAAYACFILTLCYLLYLGLGL